MNQEIVINNQEILYEKTYDLYVDQLNHFMDVINGNCPPWVSLEEVIKNVENGYTLHPRPTDFSRLKQIRLSH